MGLLSSLLTFPVSGPIAGIQWSLRQVQRIVDEELTDDTPIKQELMELQMQVELGEIDDAEYLRREADLMVRLREVRAWRERLGQETGGGPVRVAAGEAEVTIASDVPPPAPDADSPPTTPRAPAAAPKPTADSE